MVSVETPITTLGLTLEKPTGEVRKIVLAEGEVYHVDKKGEVSQPRLVIMSAEGPILRTVIEKPRPIVIFKNLKEEQAPLVMETKEHRVLLRTK